MSTADQDPRRTLRCGVFKEISAADAAVDSLLASGFRRDQIDVICSDEGKERHFSNVAHQPPAGKTSPQAAAGGGAIGLTVGGLIALGVTTATGLPLLAVGPSLLLGGAVAGGLIGAMETRGVEGAAADFYDQALTRGDLLVAVQVDDASVTPEQRDRRIELADQLLREADAAPVPLEKEI